jgi:hypothetical protein
MSHGPSISTLHGLSFHEATILSLRHDGEAIELKLEGARYAGNPYSVRLNFADAVNCKADGELVAKLWMEAKDGEILTLEVNGHAVRLLVEWNEWQPRGQFVRCYDFEASSVLIELEP